MIKANDLDGRAVVDLETAKKIGYVDEIYLDTDGARIAALRVSEGSTLTGGGHKVIIPSSAVETIGPEAIMVRAVGEEHADLDRLDTLPRLSHVVGRKVVSQGGKLLGTIDDVMLDGSDSRIRGYTLKSGSWTDSLFGGSSDDRPRYVRGDANLRLGEDLMVVPEDAIVSDSVEHDERSSIEALSTGSWPASRLTERDYPARTERLEYAEPIGRTEPVTHTEPMLDTGPVAHTGPTSDTEPVARTEPVEHWDDVRSHYRTRWEQRTGGRGGLWEEHEPGYRYGWEMANRPTFRGQTWTTAEPELRRDWETRHHDRPWDHVMDSIRDAWEGVTDRDATDVAGYRSSSHRDSEESLPAIERLSGRSTRYRAEPMSDAEHVTTRPTTSSDTSLGETERLGTRPVVDEGPDTRRALL